MGSDKSVELTSVSAKLAAIAERMQSLRVNGRTTAMQRGAAPKSTGQIMTSLGRYSFAMNSEWPLSLHNRRSIKRNMNFRLLI